MAFENAITSKDSVKHQGDSAANTTAARMLAESQGQPVDRAKTQAQDQMADRLAMPTSGEPSKQDKPQAQAAEQAKLQPQTAEERRQAQDKAMKEAREQEINFLLVEAESHALLTEGGRHNHWGLLGRIFSSSKETPMLPVKLGNTSDGTIKRHHNKTSYDSKRKDASGHLIGKTHAVVTDTGSGLSIDFTEKDGNGRKIAEIHTDVTEKIGQLDKNGQRDYEIDTASVKRDRHGLMLEKTDSQYEQVPFKSVLQIKSLEHNEPGDLIGSSLSLLAPSPFGVSVDSFELDSHNVSAANAHLHTFDGKTGLMVSGRITAAREHAAVNKAAADKNASG